MRKQAIGRVSGQAFASRRQYGYALYLQGGALSLLTIFGMANAPLVLASDTPTPTQAVTLTPASPTESAATSATVEYRTLDATFGAEAVVEAERQSTVSAQVAGRVLEINYRPGDSVPANAVIMRIDPRMAEQEVIGMDARINEARVNLDNARRQFQRVSELLKQNFVSQSDYDKSEAGFKAAEAQLKTLMASKGQAEMSAEYATISAPYAGVMSALHVEVGEMAVPGKPLATGFDPNDLRVTSRVPQTFVAQVRENQKAWVETAPGKPWIEAARIQVLPSADPRTHDTEVRVYFSQDQKASQNQKASQDQNAVAWMPGQFVRVHFVTGMERKLVVPQAAILRRSELTAVYVLEGNEQPQLRQVRVGEVQPGGWQEVLAGVKAGEKVSLNPVQATQQAR